MAADGCCAILINHGIQGLALKPAKAVEDAQLGARECSQILMDVLVLCLVFIVIVDVVDAVDHDEHETVM